MQFARTTRPHQPSLRRASLASPVRLQHRSRRAFAAASSKHPAPEDGSGSSSDDARDALPSTSSTSSASSASSPSPRRSSATSTAPPPPAPAPTPTPPPPLRAKLPTTLPALPFPARDVLVPGQTKRLHLYEARYLALLDEALARKDGCFAHVVAEPVSSLRASRNYYDVTEEYTRFQSPPGGGEEGSYDDDGDGDDDGGGFFNDDGSKKKNKRRKHKKRTFPPPPLVVGSYALRLATLARIVDVRRPPARSRAPGALVTIRGEGRLSLLSLEDDAPYLRCAVEEAADAVPTAEAVCGARGKEECEVIIGEEGEEGEEGVVSAIEQEDDDDDEEDALVAAVLSRGAQEVEALLWDVVNLSYKLPRKNGANSTSSSSSSNNGNDDDGLLRISAGRRRFRLGGAGDEIAADDDDDVDEDDDDEEEEEEPLLPDPTGTIASLQAALNWSADVPGLTPLSLATSSSGSSSSSSPSESDDIDPLAAAAERAARLGFAALQQVPHADSPASLEGLASARAAAMETDDTAERLRLAAEFLRSARAGLAAKAALRALQLG